MPDSGGVLFENLFLVLIVSSIVPFELNVSLLAPSNWYFLIIFAMKENGS